MSVVHRTRRIRLTRVRQDRPLHMREWRLMALALVN